MSGLRQFSAQVARSLRYYLYLYVDPDTHDVFYIGKGRGNRAFHHVDDSTQSEKTESIRAIRHGAETP